jgi:hypothetical protein
VQNLLSSSLLTESVMIKTYRTVTNHTNYAITTHNAVNDLSDKSFRMLYFQIFSPCNKHEHSAAVQTCACPEGPTLASIKILNALATDNGKQVWNLMHFVTNLRKSCLLGSSIHMKNFLTCVYKTGIDDEVTCEISNCIVTYCCHICIIVNMCIRRG